MFRELYAGGSCQSKQESLQGGHTSLLELSLVVVTRIHPAL